MPGHQLPDPSLELFRGGLSHLQPEPAQDPAQAHLDVLKLRLKQLARRQQRSRLLRRKRLAMHRPEPAKPHQLGNAARIVAVRLHRHRLEGITHVPRLQQLDRKTALSQRRKQPL